MFLIHKLIKVLVHELLDHVKLPLLKQCIELTDLLVRNLRRLDELSVEDHVVVLFVGEDLNEVRIVNVLIEENLVGHPLEILGELLLGLFEEVTVEVKRLRQESLTIFGQI